MVDGRAVVKVANGSAVAVGKRDSRSNNNIRIIRYRILLVQFCERNAIVVCYERLQKLRFRYHTTAVSGTLERNLFLFSSMIVSLTIAKISNLNFNWTYYFSSVMRAYDGETQTYQFSFPSCLLISFKRTTAR